MAALSLAWFRAQSCLPAGRRNRLIFSVIRQSFVDQHDRDIIFDLVKQTTRFADQSISCSVQENLSLTFRTSQNLQELFAERHLFSPLKR
jgi:hypothetical protein